MVIQHNLASMFTQRELKVITGQRAKTTEKLSSGYRINRAADDAAGLTISEKMRSLVRGLDKASENIQDGISFLQVGEGALNEIHDMLHRITELAVKSANGTNTVEDRAAIDSEVQQIKKEMTRIYNSTEFNTLAIFKAPYIPDITTMPNDYELFNGPNGSTPAGVLINHKRYTWDELGAPAVAGNTDWVKDIKDPANPDELIRLKINAGDTRENIHRVYVMEADDNGININNLRAGTWNGSIQQNGNTYSWSFHGMNLSFEAEDGDELSSIISKLNGDGITVNSWDAISIGGTPKSAVSSTADSMKINVTNSNKNDIAYWSYQIKADETSVGLVQTNGNDGLTHTKTNWSSFTNQNGGESFPISDWGTENEGSNPVTLDSTAVYKYTDSASGSGLTDGMTFTFSFPTSEVNKSQAISGLTQNLSGDPYVSAPISSVTSNDGATVTGYSGFNNFNFQRDKLNRDFGSTGSSTAMSINVDRTMVKDETVTDHEWRRELSAAYAKRIDTWLDQEIVTYGDIAGVVFVDNDGNPMDNLPDGATYNQNAPWISPIQSFGGTSSYVSNTGLSADWTDTSLPQKISDTTGTDTVLRSIKLNGSIIGQAKITFNTNTVVNRTTTSTYEKTSGGEIKNYVSNGSGGYKEAAYNTLYVMDTDTSHDKDTAGNTYHALTNGDGSGQRYLQTGSAYIAVKTYDYDHYKYSAKNSDGTEIMSNNASGTKFLKTGGTSQNITITNSDGSTTTYRTENNSALNSATLSGNGASLSLNYTAGSGNQSNTITVTPDGAASRTFTKTSRSAGTSYDTNLTVKVNPPQKLLNIQAGALQGQVITLEWPALSNSIVGISGAKVDSVETSLSTIAMTDDALATISKVRSDFGAMQNRLESAYRIDRNTQENTQAAESLIRDADMAKEMVAHSRNEILTSAAMSMLSQANAQPQSILSLLS